MHFSTHGHKSRHIKRNNCKPKNIILQTTYNVPLILHYIYLLKEREFVVNNLNIYKLGKSKQENTKRIKSYPKGSSLFIQVICLDCDKTEILLLNLFNKKFIDRPDIGKEYFEGNFKDMIKIITENTNNYI